MAIPVTPKPAFPNVPLLPGVPPIPRPSGFVQAQNSIVLLAADAASVLSLFGFAQWGLFDDTGSPAFAAIPGLGTLSALIGNVSQALGIGGQSVSEIEYRSDHRISTAPQEQGAFLSYNKVSMPFNAKVSYVVGGFEANRTAFLARVQSLEASLTLLSLRMPEYSYDSVNIVHSDFRREARRGVSMFVVDIWVEEVRVTGTAAFTSTAQPSGAGQVNGGTVQPGVPTQVQSNSLPPGALT